MFEKIKKFYALGLWTENMVEDAVGKGVITEEEYETICNITKGREKW